jgi:hypothetical protein
MKELIENVRAMKAEGVERKNIFANEKTYGRRYRAKFGRSDLPRFTFFNYL